MASGLDSTSGYSDAKAAYLDNMTWYEDGSVSKAKAFVTACSMLLFLIPKRQQDGQFDTEIDPGVIKGQMADARKFADGQNASGTGKAVSQARMGGFR